MRTVRTQLSIRPLIRSMAGRQICSSAGAEGAGIGIELVVPESTIESLISCNSSPKQLRLISQVIRILAYVSAVPHVASFIATHLGQNGTFYF